MSNRLIQAIGAVFGWPRTVSVSAGAENVTLYIERNGRPAQAISIPHSETGQVALTLFECARQQTPLELRVQRAAGISEVLVIPAWAVREAGVLVAERAIRRWQEHADTIAAALSLLEQGELTDDDLAFIRSRLSRVV